jgi:hypothetical protein
VSRPPERTQCHKVALMKDSGYCQIQAR